MPADDNRQGPEHLWRPRPGGARSAASATRPARNTPRGS